MSSIGTEPGDSHKAGSWVIIIAAIIPSLTFVWVLCVWVYLYRNRYRLYPNGYRLWPGGSLHTYRPVVPGVENGQQEPPPVYKPGSTHVDRGLAAPSSAHLTAAH